MADQKYLRTNLWPAENAHFRANPHVAGRAAEDGKVTLNPYSPLGGDERAAVYQNELARLLMRGQLGGGGFRPAFDLTPAQNAMLDGTDYAQAPIQDRRETIAARMVSGDPSAGEPTGDQWAFKQALVRALRGYQ